MRTLVRFIRRQWIARPLATCSIAFLFGIFGANHWRIPVSVWLAAAAAAMCAGLVHSVRTRRLSVLMLVLAFLLGGLRMEAALLACAPVPERFSIFYEGDIVSEPVYNEETERIVCALRLSELDGDAENRVVRLYLRSDQLELEGIEYGQHIRCFGHVWPQEHATNPYEFDASDWLLGDGMSGMAAAKLEDVEVLSCAPGIQGRLIAVRQGIADRIEALFPKNAELVKALVLGDRNGLDVELREAFNQAGVTHLICISGLHISVLAFAISKLLGRIFPPGICVTSTLIAVLLYGALIGFPASLIRATIMFAVFSFAPLVGRPSDSITRLCAALLEMLAVQPLNIYDGGFVLSFEASAGILLLGPVLENLFHVDVLRHRKPFAAWGTNQLLRMARYFPGLLCTTLAAQLATLPTVIAYFGAQPLASIPANLIAIPLAMLAYPMALVVLCVSVIALPAAAFLATLPDALFSLLVEVVHLFSALPFSEVRAPLYPIWLLAAHWALMIFISGMNRISIRVRRVLPAALAGFVGLSMLCAWIGTLGFRVVFFDAGQADSAAVCTGGNVYLFDVGDLYTPAVDYVTACCPGVEAVFLSHPHYDHAAGLTELLEEMPPKVIYVPEGWFEVDAASSVQEGIDLAQALQIPIVELSAGDEVQLSDHAFARVCEAGKPSSNVNDLSMLVEVVYKESSILFTGDLSIEGEPDHFPDADVLKVPHHGSSKACSDHLLEEVTPEISIVSVGDNNYGHPSDDTLQRLSESGSEVYRTDQTGAVTVKIGSDGEFSVETYLPSEESR